MELLEILREVYEIAKQIETIVTLNGNNVELRLLDKRLKEIENELSSMASVKNPPLPHLD